jgi:dihydropteroate synthase
VKRYTRPLGILSGATAREAVAAGLALPLAGGPLAFSLVEIIERHKPLAREAGEGGAQPERAGRVRVLSSVAEDPRLPTADAAGPFLSRFAGEAFRTAPLIMGILNATPDSFSDGGAWLDTATAVAHGAAMLRAGAAIIDVGGESTRPGAAPVDPALEIRRVVPVIAGLRPAAEAAGAMISVDTRNAATMRAALDAGAGMVNDVSALTHDRAALAVVAASLASVVLMHMRGEPATMQVAPAYDDVALDVYDYLEGRIAACEAAGIDRSRIVADPGIGFGKTVAHNLRLLRQLTLFHGLGVPILVGASRKGFIARLSAGEPPEDRLPGSIAAALSAVGQGAQILRVHDVAETIQALRVAAALRDY